MIPVDYLLRGKAFLVCLDRDRSAVYIATRNHQDFVPGHAVIASEYVRGEVGAGDMPQMQ